MQERPALFMPVTIRRTGGNDCSVMMDSIGSFRNPQSGTGQSRILSKRRERLRPQVVRIPLGQYQQSALAGPADEDKAEFLATFRLPAFIRKASDCCRHG